MIVPQGYDLHVHTTHSDGSCAPGEVVRNAAAVGLAGLAITDHDTLSGLEAARSEAQRLAIDLVNGVELSVQDSVSGCDRHLLGYEFRSNDPGLVQALGVYRERRQRRAEAITARLGTLGYRVDLAAIQRQSMRSVPGRRHFANWLVGTGQIRDRREAFFGLLEAGGPAHVALDALEVADAIRLIHAAGGAAVLAHPGRGLRRQELERLVGLGLDGVEVVFPGVPRQRRERLAGWASEMGLLVTAGSDFHAADGVRRWVGAIRCEASTVSAIRRRAARWAGEEPPSRG